MPKYYYLAKFTQQTVSYRIHSQGCILLPVMKDRHFLGSFYHEGDAVKVSRMRIPGSIPCPDCFDNPMKYRKKI